MKPNFQQLRELVVMAEHAGYFDWALRLREQIARLERVFEQAA